MHDSLQVRSTVTLYADYTEPAYHCEHSDGRHAVRLAPITSSTDVYLTGTLDELAAFVLELAGVVRELNARELAAAAEGIDCDPRDAAFAPFDGTVRPVRDIVSALDRRFARS